MDVIDEMFDNILLLLLKIKDTEYKEKLESRYEQLRKYYENMRETNATQATTQEIHLEFGQSPLIVLLSEITDLEILINSYMKNGTEVDINTSKRLEIDVSNTPQFTFIETYTKVLERMDNYLPEETRISFIEKIEEKFRRYEIHSQKIDQLIAMRRYEIIVALIKKEKIQEASQIIEKLGTDMKIYISKRFNDNKEEIISSGDLELIEKMIDYMQEIQNHNERDVLFWLKTVVPMEKIINREGIIEDSTELLPVEIKKEGRIKSFFKKLFGKEKKRRDQVSGNMAGSRESVNNNGNSEYKPNYDESQQLQIVEERTQPEQEVETKEQAQTEEDSYRLNKIEETMRIILRESTPSTEWIETRKRARKNTEEQLIEMKEILKTKRLKDEITINEQNKIDEFKQKLQIEIDYIQQYKKVERSKKELVAFYNKLRDKINNKGNEKSDIEELEKMIKMYNDEKIKLTELENAIIALDTAERNRIEEEIRKQREREELDKRRRMEEEKRAQAKKEKEKQIDKELLPDRQAKNKLKRKLNILSETIKQMKQNGQDTKEMEAEYREILIQYENLQRKIDERIKKMESGIFVVDDNLGENIYPKEKEFTAQDIAEAGFGVSVTTCLEAEQVITQKAKEEQNKN